MSIKIYVRLNWGSFGAAMNSGSVSADILERYGDAFARALSVFVREMSRQGVSNSEESDASLMRRLETQVAENDRLEKLGKLKTVPFDGQAERRSISERIRAVMRERRMTQARLAKALGITPANISRILKNPERSKVETFERIARALNVDLDALFSPRLSG
ncbi:MAG TPA: helix-turn-helix transcriptional regulator [Pirellulaceae bacterium]|nr:helix-turn-helix transcriptional regulator [Pirellulaceae bacterium]